MTTTIRQTILDVLDGVDLGDYTALVDNVVTALEERESGIRHQIVRYADVQDLDIEAANNLLDDLGLGVEPDYGVLPGDYHDFMRDIEVEQSEPLPSYVTSTDRIEDLVAALVDAIRTELSHE